MIYKYTYVWELHFNQINKKAKKFEALLILDGTL